MIAFAAVNQSGRAQVFLRSLHSDELHTVDGSAGTLGGIAFSADGKWVAFNANRKVYKASVKGGPATPLANSGWAHLAWVGSDAVIYTRNYDSGLLKVSSEGRDSVTLTEPDRKKGELGHWWPQLLPDGDHVLFTNYTTPADKSKIEVLSLKSGKRQVVLDGGYFGRYVKGHLVFVRDAGTMTVPFDAGSLKTKGSAVPLDLDVEINPPSGWAAFAIAPNGTLVYRKDELKSVSITWADEGGNEEAAVDSSARYTGIEASPDRKKLAVVRDGDVWIYDRQRKLFSRLTQTEQREVNLFWTPDSREVVYARDEPQYDVFKRSADGSRAEERVSTSPNDKTPRQVSPDGRLLIYDEDAGGGNAQDVFVVSPNPSQPMEKRMVVGGPGNQTEARFSPDGKWIVYSSDESGRKEIFVAPYPADRGPSRQQVSSGGGFTPHFSADGRTIYYGWNARIIKAAFNPGTGDIGTPETLTKIQPVLDWTTAPDGRFLVLRVSKAAERRSVKVVLNWAAALEAKN